MDTVIDCPEDTVAFTNPAEGKEEGEGDMVWDESTWDLTDFNADFEANLNLNAPFETL